MEMNSVGTRVISISLTFGSTPRSSSSMNVGDPLALADRGDEVGRVDDVVAGRPDVGQLGLQVLFEQRDAAAVRSAPRRRPGDGCPGAGRSRRGPCRRG